MAYKTPPIHNKYRKKRIHHSGVYIVSVAFLAFIMIGLTVSVSIRACTHHEDYVRETPRSHQNSSHSIDIEPEVVPEVSSDYVMSDSVASICMPAPLENVSEQIIRKIAYIASYNKDTKTPNWVAWHLTAEHTDGPYKRLSNFHEEEDVPEPRATLQDYRGSGWSRGHMCPAGDNKWNSDAMYESFSLVNVCPQNNSHNSGLWNSIEMDCRRWARQYGDIYIVCGPVLMRENHETIGENAVVVPEAFFKVVLCLNGKPKGFGIVTRNTDGNRKRDLYYNSIDQVERITGIDFFPALPDELENCIESDVNMNLWN